MTLRFRASVAPVFLILLLFANGAFAQQLELQSKNPGFWNADEARNWRSNTGQSLADAGSVTLQGADRGAYQIVPVVRNSEHQLLSIKAVHQSLDGSQNGYAGFGINYYDVNFNFLRREEKKIPVTISSPDVQTPDFDNVRPMTLGAKIPGAAAFAVIWVWNVGAGDVTYADNFGLYNYFQFGEFTYDVLRPVGRRYRATAGEFRNIVINGTTDFQGLADLAGEDFYPDRPNGAAELFPELSGDDFWRILNPFNDSVRPFIPTGSLRVGNYSAATVMWQQLTVDPGARYSFRTLVDNIPVYGGFNSVNNHYGTIGIDFFDASWNEIADVRLDANGPRLTDFVVPAETRFATVWVWAPPARNGQYTDLDLREIEIKKFEESDFAPKVRLLSQPPAITSVPDNPVGIAIFGQAGSPVNFPQFGAGGDVTITGPGGSFGISYITGGPKGDGVWELIYANWNFPDGVPVNGIYEIRVSEGFVTDGQAESPETVVGFLEVSIPGR